MVFSPLLHSNISLKKLSKPKICPIHTQKWKIYDLNVLYATFGEKLNYKSGLSDILRFNYVQPIKLNAVYSLSFVHDRAPELPTTLIASRLHPLPCKKVESWF